MKRALSFLLFFALLLTSMTAFAASDETSQESPRFVIHLLDYLAHDYGGAVENGKVISADEYAEQKEFVQKCHELSLKLPELKNVTEAVAKIAKLKTLIESKADAKKVAELARDIQKDLITATKVTFAPTSWPDITNGQKLYAQNCLGCHGENGRGDGPDGKTLEPKPANFHNPERMSAISAFHAYNTIRLGVPGTGMVSWPQFTDKEVWDLSFYVMSIRHPKEASGIAMPSNITLEELATLSDNELKEKTNEKEENKKWLALALIRNKHNDSSGGQYLDLSRKYLAQALAAFKNNNRDGAKKLAIQAYLEGIEPVEPMIKANNPALVSDVERAMGEVRRVIDDPAGTAIQLMNEIRETENVLGEVAKTIEARELSFSVAFSGAFAIILREGFEAVLIILTLLTVIKAFGNRRAAFYVHAGWSSALGLGFITWFASGLLMKLSGASREVLEAVTSTLAVFILLYFGFWLHRQTEISRWKKFIQEKVQGALDNKNLFALFSISFISVFREAFETVLFIRALWFQTNADGRNAIGLGLIAALGLIFFFSIMTLKYSKKIPVRELFRVSSFMTSILAFILAGKAVHSLQEAGMLNSTSLPWKFSFETIGLFPTWQTIVAQVATIGLAFVLVNFNMKKPAAAIKSNN